MTITSGGIAFRANGNNVKYWDTVQRTPGVNVATGEAITSIVSAQVARTTSLEKALPDQI